MRKYKVVDCIFEDFESGWACWAWFEDVKTGKEFAFEIVEAADLLDLINSREPVSMEIFVKIDNDVVFYDEYTEDERKMVIRDVIKEFGDLIDELSKKCKNVKMMLSKFVPRYS